MIKTSNWRQLCLVFYSLISIAFLQSLEARTFTSVDGRKIEAEIIKSTGDSVVLKRKGVGNVTVPLNKLSKADQKYVKEWAIEEAKNRIPRIDLVINTNKRDTRQDNAYEDREGSFQFEIIIENEELGFDIKNASATLIVMGDYMYEKGNKIVMQRKDFKNINIVDGGSRTLSAEKVNYEYDKDGYKHGEKYWGYLFQLRNSVGKVIEAKSSSGSILNNAETVLEFKQNDRFEGQSYKKAGARR